MTTLIPSLSYNGIIILERKFHDQKVYIRFQLINTQNFGSFGSFKLVKEQKQLILRGDVKT